MDSEITHYKGTEDMISMPGKKYQGKLGRRGWEWVGLGQGCGSVKIQRQKAQRPFPDRFPPEQESIIYSKMFTILDVVDRFVFPVL